jgi:hypothetical protein
MPPQYFFYLRIVLATGLKRANEKMGKGQRGRKGNRYIKDWFKPLVTFPRHFPSKCPSIAPVET